MPHLIITILEILVFLALIAAVYWLIRWVFEMVGWPIPEMALKCLAVALVLVAIIWLVSVMFGAAPGFTLLR